MPSAARGVGQEEQPLSAMGRTDFRRTEYSAFNAVVHCAKVRPDGIESDVDVLSDILEEAECWLDFPNDASNVGPEMARVVNAALLSGDTEWLARVAANDAIHDATPRLAVEGSQVAPNRCVIQGFVLNARNQERGGICFSLNVTDGDSSASRQSDTEIESTVS